MFPKVNDHRNVIRGSSASVEPSHPTVMKLLLFLSDISASEAFVSCNPIDGPVIGKLMDWLRTGSVELTKCACLMLGNSARSNELCEAMLSTPSSIPEAQSIPQHLSNIVEQNHDRTLTHAALGLTGNLSQPVANKNHFGDFGLVEKICSVISVRVITHDVNIAGLRALRLLVRDSWGNTERLFSRTRADMMSNLIDENKNGPDEITSSEYRTNFSVIVRQLWNTEDFQVLVEVGRLIIAVLRNIHSLQISQEQSKRVFMLVLQEDITAKYLSYLLQQEKMKHVRSEALFGAALLCRSKEGALYFSQTLDDALVKVLEDVVEGTSSATDVDTRDNYDSDNTMVLVSELLKFQVSLSILSLAAHVNFVKGYRYRSKQRTVSSPKAHLGAT